MPYIEHNYRGYCEDHNRYLNTVFEIPWCSHFNKEHEFYSLSEPQEKFPWSVRRARNFLLPPLVRTSWTLFGASYKENTIVENSLFSSFENICAVVISSIFVCQSRKFVVYANLFMLKTRLVLCQIWHDWQSSIYAEDLHSDIQAFQSGRVKHMVRGVATGWVWCHTPPKIFKNRENSGKLRENSGKLRENSVTSGNICGC